MEYYILINKVNAVGRKSQFTAEIEKQLKNINKATKGKLTILQWAAEYSRHYDSMAYTTCFRYCILSEAYSVDFYLKQSLTGDPKNERVRWVLSRLL